MLSFLLNTIQITKNAIILCNFHTGVELEELFHELVGREGGGDHWYGPDIVDTHSSIETLHYTIVAVYESQCLHHSGTVEIKILFKTF